MVEPPPAESPRRSEISHAHDRTYPQQLLGGAEENRKTLEPFLRHHHSQGLSSREVKVEELFHPGTLETFKL